MTTFIFTAVLAYAAIGVLFATAFVLVGAARVDHAAAGAPLTFRLLILPGSAALWPLLAIRWLRAGPPVQANATDAGSISSAQALRSGPAGPTHAA